jgi:uncharacterized protein DUF2845
MRAVVFALVFCFGPVAFADDGLRCGDRLVSVGETQSDVAAKCGQPTRAETRHEQSYTRCGTMRGTVDFWTYDRGPGDFVRTLTFRQGLLRDVAVGGYGSP